MAYSNVISDTDDALTVAYVSTHDPHDKNSFRGVPYYLTSSLEKAGATVERPAPLENNHQRLTTWKRRFYKYALDKKYTWYHEPKVLKGFARQIEERLAKSKADVALVQEPQVIACRDWDRPVAIHTDCFLAAMVDYYLGATDLSRESLRNGDRIERNALKKADLIIGTSEWAADTAVSNYGVPSSKTKVIPWGANLESDRTETDVRKSIAHRSQETCQLLFVGVAWERKGGDVAVEVARLLNERGTPTRLAIVGCEPDTRDSYPSFVHTLGFIDKSTPEGAARFDEVFERSHFFILPSQAETFGHVFCEASSFGVPSLAPNTGGVPTVVRDGKNGKVFGRDDPESMADYVQELFREYESYRRLALSSFCEYQARLNWAAAGSALKEELSLLAERGQAA